MAGALTYLSAQPLPAGTLVRVPGATRTAGRGVGHARPACRGRRSHPQRLRPGQAAPDRRRAGRAGPVERELARLIGRASYYQRSAGEVALAALPPQLRDLSSVQLARRLKKKAANLSKAQASRCATSATADPADARAAHTARQLPDHA